MKRAGLFSISDVAKMLKLEKHVLRFWERNFPILSPIRITGGHRYYSPEDIAILRSIHTLLKCHGYTTRGVQKLLHKKGKKYIISLSNKQSPTPYQGSQEEATPHVKTASQYLHIIRSLRKEIEEVIDR